MPGYHAIKRPERPRGTEEQKWEQVYRYLWKLSEQLENIINSLSGKGEDGNAEENKG